MGILKGLFRTRDAPTNRTAGSAYSFFMGGSTSGKRVNERSAMQMTAVYSCVRILSEAIASLPLHLYKYDENGSKEKAIEHPLYTLLHDEPNPEMTSFVFRETLMTHLLLWGNAYAQIIRNGKGEVVALYPLMPDRMKVDRDDQGHLYYEYQVSSDDAPTNKGAIVKLKPDEVMHIPGLGFDGLVGYSPIAMAKNAIGLAIAAEEYGSKFYANGAAPSGVLEHPGTLKDPSKVRDSWSQTFGGSANSHKVAVLEEGMKYTPISISPNEAQFLETRKFQIDEIARIFRVPPHMVGDLEKSSFSNIEQQSLEFVKYTLDPWVSRWEQNMIRSLLSEEEKKKYFIKFNVDGLLRGDYQSRMNGYATARQNGWMSANDIRELENLDRIPAELGGDLYLINGNMTKLCAVGTLPTGITVKTNTAATASAAGKLELSVASSSNLGADASLTGNITLTFTISGKTVTKVFTWTKSKAGSNGASAVVFSVYAPNGTIVQNQSGSILLATSAYAGSTAITSAAYQWAKYSSGSWTNISGATSETLTVSGSDIINIQSYRCTMTYGGKAYVDVITVEDKSDPYVSEMLSIGGYTVKNNLGGVVPYVIVRTNQKEVDSLLGSISETAPSAPKSGDFWYKIDHTEKSVTLMKYNGTSWISASEKQSLMYTWYAQDKDGKEMTFNKAGKVIYLSAADIDSIMTLKLGSYSNTISSSASLISYAIPISWCNAVTDNITGAASITGQVLFGGKVYKTFTANLTVSVPDTVIPSISSVTFSDVDDSVVPSSWGIYVQGQSGLKLKSISCAGAYGSEIKKVKMTADSRIRTTDYPELPEMDHISQSGEVSVMITVTDSRNRTVNKSAVVSIVSYASPKLSSIKSERCNALGETDNDGTYFLSTTSAVFSSCLGKNTLTLTVKYKRTDLKNYGNEVQINPGSNVCANNDLDPEYSYDVLYTLSDEFNTVTYSDFVSTAVYLMHFLHGGRGVAFGQKATLADTLDCNFNAVFRKKLSCVLDDGTVLEVRDMMEQIQNNLVNMLCPKGKLPALLLDLLYPIGSIYMSTSSANPTNIMGGIWVSWGEGRVPVGVGTGTDSNNTSVDFSAANQTGGEYTHLLTGAESGQKAVQTGSQSASHTHSLTYNADSGAAASGSDPSGRGAFVRRTASGGATSTWKTGNQSASHTHSISASNASNRHNNIQPYVTCYMWKRTA